jgi:ankyrin repeat protein
MAVENVIPVVLALIEVGAEIDSVNHFDATPLQEAVQLGRTEICLALLARGADVTHKNDLGETVIATATILKRHTQLVTALLDRLPSDTSLADLLDDTTIEWLRHRDDAVARLFRARGLPDTPSP